MLFFSCTLNPISMDRSWGTVPHEQHEWLNVLTSLTALESTGIFNDG